MSQENVELVRATIEVFNRRDMDALAEVSHEDLLIVSALTAANLGDAAYRGPEAFVSYFAAMDEAWQDWRIEDFELVDGGNDGVACLCRLVGRGLQSGVPVERAVGITFRIRQAQLWRIRSYLDPAEALEAVRRSE